MTKFGEKVVALFGRRAPLERPGLRRYQAIMRGGVTGFGAKALAALVNFATVPLLIGHFGGTVYGLWAVLFSLIAWLGLADLGLGNGLLNALSDALARHDAGRAREYLSAGLITLGGAGSLCALAILLAVPLVNWQDLLNIEAPAIAADFRTALIIAAVLLAVLLPTTVVGKLYTAQQRGERANLWAALASVASFGGVLLAVHFDAGLAATAAGYLGGQLLVGAASFAWAFRRDAPALRPRQPASRASIRHLLTLSGPYFLTQLATALLFQSANIVIAHGSSPAEVAPFHVTWMLFFYLTLPQQLIGAHVWATVADARARGEFDWIRTLFRRYLFASLAAGMPMVAALALAAPRLIELWAGPEAVPERSLVLWMALWGLVLFAMQPLIAVLGGTAQLARYARYSIVGAVLAVAGSLYAVQAHGATGVIAAIVLAFICCCLGPAIVETRRVLATLHRSPLSPQPIGSGGP